MSEPPASALASSRRPGPLALEFTRAHPDEAAAVLEQAARPDLAALLAALPAELAAALLGHLLPLAASEGLGALEAAAAATIVRHLPVDPAAALLGRLDSRQRDEIVALLPRAAALPLRLLLRYRPGTVGSIADPIALTARPQMRVGEVLRLARKSPGQLRKYLYVLDQGQRLLGTVDSRACLLAARDARIETLMRPDPMALNAGRTLAEVRTHSAWDRFTLLPVVTRGRHFVGVLRRHSLIQALGREPAPDREPGFADTLLGLADLYWQGSAALFTGSLGPTGERKHDA